MTPRARCVAAEQIAEAHDYVAPPKTGATLSFAVCGLNDLPSGEADFMNGGSDRPECRGARARRCRHVT
jgi:hypothetical protein